jgi:hypothetical protein
MSWKEYQKTGTLGTENKRTLTLLIVDDERGILNTLEESFRDMFKVHTANSGAGGPADLPRQGESTSSSATSACQR